MHERPDDRPDRGAVDADERPEEDRPEHDAEVVEDRREAIAQEALAGDEHLAERERGGEDEGGDEHDPEELDVQRTLDRIEARDDQLSGRWGDDEEDHVGHGHEQDGHGQDGPAELGRAVDELTLRATEDGHERGRQAGDDEHVEDELGHDERRVVGIELDARPERSGERPVAQEAHDVARERQGREEHGALRQDDPEPPEEASERPAHQGVGPGDGAAEGASRRGWGPGGARPPTSTADLARRRG